MNVTVLCKQNRSMILLHNLDIPFEREVTIKETLYL